MTFNEALDKAIDMIADGSNNKFCGEMDISQSYFYKMVDEGRLSPGLAVEVERAVDGAVLAMHLCPYKKRKVA